jgi:hypothetical protein
MCTLVILRQQENDWPIIIGANRDEMVSRPWLAPGRHWPDRADVIAGQDQLAGGSWLGMNDAGVIAAINNRTGSLGPQADKRSRGELVLEALDHASAGEAADALRYLNPDAYRPFNLLIADASEVYWLRHLGPEESNRIEVFPIPQGLSILTAYDFNDRRCQRTQTYLPRFKAAETPQPDENHWEEWEALLLSRESDSNDATDALRIVTDGEFNTVSSSLIALPSEDSEVKPIWRFAHRYPNAEPYQKISLGDS